MSELQRVFNNINSAMTSTEAMNTLYSVFCILLIFLDVTLSDVRNFRIYFDEFTIIQKEPDLFDKMDSSLIQLNNRSYVNAEMILKRGVGDVVIHTKMDFWKPNNKQKTKLYDVRFNACAFLRNVQSNQLFNTYVKSFKKHVNFNLVCPLKANYSYKLVNWFLDEMDLPSFSPIGGFYTVTDYFTPKKWVLRIVTRGNIRKYES